MVPSCCYFFGRDPRGSLALSLLTLLYIYVLSAAVSCGVGSSWLRARVYKFAYIAFLLYF